MRHTARILALSALSVLVACAEPSAPASRPELADVRAALVDYGPCTTMITETQALTATARFMGKYAEKDRAGAMLKLENAKVKLGELKPADALQKIADYTLKVETTAATGKLHPDDAPAMRSGANAASACIVAAG